MAFAIFFMSGFAALLYQVIWQRLLVIFAGGDIYSVTIIVSAFMAGLGMGSLAGGHIADRLSARGSLWLFALAELAVGSFALVSKTLYYDVLYTRLSFLAGSPAGPIVLFISLLWPTFFMGVSLPLLARGLTPAVSAAGNVIGALYGWNALGAAAGAFATTWWLLPRFGLTDALVIGAIVSFGCAAAAMLVANRAGRVNVSGPTVSSSPTTASRISFPAWAWVFGLTGFVALALEIVWFRLLGVMLKSAAFTFGTMLAAYLAGLGAGAVIGARLVPGSRRPGMTFLALQTALILVTGVSFAAFVAQVSSGRPEWLVEYLGSPVYGVDGGIAAIRDIIAGQAAPEQWTHVRQFIALYGFLPAALISVPTFLMGLSFPYLQKAAQADFGRIGRCVGMLMTANIIGSTIGAALTGLVLLPWFGAATTLKVLVAFAAVPALLLVRQARADGAARLAPRAMTVAIVVVTVAIVAMLPRNAVLWSALHGTGPARVVAAEDGAGVSVLRAEGAGFERTTVFVNGSSQSWIPFGQIHTALGALPALLHPSPAEIAVIGLGSGDTVFSVAARADVKQVVCIEIIGAQLRTLERLAAGIRDPGLVALLADTRISHVEGDGRAYLSQSDRRFDIIEADALRPSSAYAGNLYSVEYFELLRRRLKPGGLAVSWAPTPRVRRTFVTVFPHVLAFGEIYIGSNEPIAFDREAVMERMAHPDVRHYYARAGISIERHLEPWLSGVVEVFGADHDRVGLQDLNADLFPKDEFNLPRILPEW